MIMRDPRFEPEAAGDGEVEVNLLWVPHTIGTQSVRAESGDAKEERSVRLQMREVTILHVDFVDRG